MKINKILIVILALIIPFIILMGGVRLIMNPKFAELEYDRASFPADPYGMETRERKQWSNYTIRYLTNNEPIEYLGKLQTFQGEKIFTESELSHMLDVKKVVQRSLIAWYVIIGLSVASLIWFMVMGQWKAIRQALHAGGWVTLGLIGALLVFLVVRFDALFEQFHRFFFAEGTWIFEESSTLIRLFPFVFWRDAFALVLTFTFVVALLLVIVTFRRKQKPAV